MKLFHVGFKVLGITQFRSYQGRVSWVNGNPAVLLKLYFFILRNTSTRSLARMRTEMLCQPEAACRDPRPLPFKYLADYPLALRTGKVVFICLGLISNCLYPVQMLHPVIRQMGGGNLPSAVSVIRH